MTYLSDETVKQIFFYCTDDDKTALFADNVDIVQFADKIIAYARPLIAKDEHARCVQIVRDMNKDVAKALDGQLPN